MKNKLLLSGCMIFTLIFTSFTASADCDPINTYCQSTTTRVCELGEDTIERVAKYVCIWVPDPKWYNPANMKKKCLTEYSDKLIPGSATCKNVAALSCPSVTGLSSLSCDTAMDVVSSCIKGDFSACAEAHRSATIAGTFGGLCAAYVIHQSGILESSYETRINNLIDSSLEADIRYIFGTLLGDSKFDDYVRGTVKFYKTSNTALNNMMPSNDTGQRGKATPGKVFFNTMSPSKDLIMHELVHIWQYRHRGVQGLTMDGCEDFFKVLSVDKQYEFSLSSGKKFSSYGVEQQAEIVQTYYRFMRGPTPSCANVPNFLNCASYSNNAARERALRQAISGTTSTSTPTAPPGRLLFSGNCEAQYCEAPSRRCYSEGGVFSMTGSYYYCHAR